MKYHDTSQQDVQMSDNRKIYNDIEIAIDKAKRVFKNGQEERLQKVGWCSCVCKDMFVRDLYFFVIFVLWE